MDILALRVARQPPFANDPHLRIADALDTQFAKPESTDGRRKDSGRGVKK